ncbi:hypothetical protein [Streptomyces sp. TBY4]|uniref:hypothetical protein n=1 Tax=Streptomyces sp. TBY4 TaxID=2962030 RepID=UPI0020B6D1E8|nr:hypothetical protein [Streptomyces sp. TBY4]MCP3756302.1 hypothetical protein [Streptomyces sp. TBY4]
MATSPTSFTVDKESLLVGVRLLFPDAEGTDDGIVIKDGLTIAGRTIDRIKTSEIDEIAKTLRECISVSTSAVHWTDKAEFTVIPLNDHGFFDGIFGERQIGEQGEEGVSYKVGKPSSVFIAHLLCSLAQNSEVLKTPRWNGIKRRTRMVRNNPKYRNLEPIDGLLDLIAELVMTTTLQIDASKPRVDFDTLANGFLFHAAYNLDAAARLGSDSTFGPPRIQRVRRMKELELDAPRQSYNTDLIHHYLMGVAAEIPLLEYLSYYHIAEHFFEKVFNDDLIEQVRKGITDPSFSVRRAKDIQSIIKTVNSAQKQVREEGGVNEQRALELVLAKFIDIDRLISDLNAWDGTLVAHYKTTGVPFADAGRVDLQATDSNEIKKALAKRIYKVRNSLVHAKDGALPRYAPFAHDAELSKEIPLIRFTSEQIVIAHGKAL